MDPGAVLKNMGAERVGELVMDVFRRCGGGFDGLQGYVCVL